MRILTCMHTKNAVKPASCNCRLCVGCFFQLKLFRKRLYCITTKWKKSPPTQFEPEMNQTVSLQVSTKVWYTQIRGLWLRDYKMCVHFMQVAESRQETLILGFVFKLMRKNTFPKYVSNTPTILSQYKLIRIVFKDVLLYISNVKNIFLYNV